MKRIPEPELMNDYAQALAYAEADFSEAHDMFVKLFGEFFPDASESRHAVDLGCGPADVTRRFALAYPRCRLDAVDAAENMLRLGREAVMRAGLTDRVRLIRDRIPGTAFPGGRYDTVISNSLLHHLAHPADLWTTVRRCAAAGARIFVMDLMRPDNLRRLEQLVSCHAADAPAVLKRDFRASLGAAYRPDEIYSQLQEAGLAYCQVRAVSDRHVVVFGRFQPDEAKPAGEVVE